MTSVPLESPVSEAPVTVPAGTSSPMAGWVRLSIEAATILLVWMAGASFFFRSELSSGFGKVLGDDHDTVQLSLLLEHWFHVLHGQASWQNPAIFYPLKGVLGWSDGMVLFQVVYAPLRLLGCDMFLAAALTVVLFSLVGFASFVCLARVAFGAQRWIALIGGLAFTFANDLWLHIYWTQLLEVWMVPGIVLLGVLAFRAHPEHPVRSLVLGALCGLLAALIFFTDFYVAWFSALTVGVALIMVLLLGRAEVVRRLLARGRDSWRLVLTMGASFAVGLIPFLDTYLPAEKTVHPVGYGAVMRVAPRTRDLLNVGQGNVFWTSIVHHWVSTFDLNFSALTYAVTPILMTVAVVGAVLAVWLSRSQAAEGEGWPMAAKAAVVFAATAVVLAALPLDTRFGSLWAIVWHIPGATVIRRNGRIGVVVGLVASMAAVCGASVVYRAGGRQPYRSVRRGAVVVLLLLAAVEQMNTNPMAHLHRDKQLAFLRSAQPPPPGCRSFYVLEPVHTYPPAAAPEADARAVSDQIDAMLVSDKYLLPTLNGYTSYAPNGWGLRDPFGAGYLANVRSWVTEHDLQNGLCQLDLDTMLWQTAAATAAQLGETPGSAVTAVFPRPALK